ncbi:MAG: hypothetical protein WD971_14180 [Pirellulales bacterium]
MPGRRRTSFRSGDLAEDLGIFLLKGIAAVAEVTRQEDVGLDAIATLLRRDDDGNSYAEDTFVVQLKSESEDEIEYCDHGFQWFTQQALPMFIGRVSLIRSEIALYPTIFANQAIWSLHAADIRIRFGNSDLPPMLREQLRSPWTISGERPTVWLGEPLMRWTAAELVDRNWCNGAYRMLKRFIPKVQRELALLSLGQSSVIEWSTNDADSIRVKRGMMKGHPSDLQSTIDQCEPSLYALMLKGLTLPDSTGEPILHCLEGLINELRKLDVSIDVDNLVKMLHFAVKKRAETK